MNSVPIIAGKIGVAAPDPQGGDGSDGETEASPPEPSPCEVPS